MEVSLGSIILESVIEFVLKGAGLFHTMKCLELLFVFIWEKTKLRTKVLDRAHIRYIHPCSVLLMSYDETVATNVSNDMLSLSGLLSRSLYQPVTSEECPLVYDTTPTAIITTPACILQTTQTQSNKVASGVSAPNITSKLNHTVLE